MTPVRSQDAVRLRDIWTNSQEYRAEQVPEIHDILRLLDLKHASSLVDMGCGNGAFAIAAARAHPNCRVWAFDALESAVAECRIAAADLPPDQFHTGVASAQSLPLEDASADRLLCRAVLHHVRDASAVYAEMARLLKPGGLLLLQAPCNYWQKPFGALISDLYMIMDDSHRRTYHQPGEIITGLSHAGFAMESAQCWTYLHSVDAPQMDLIHRHSAQERLHLRQTSAGEWVVDLYWVRVIARRI